ncbi:Voltage-dependent calcium channel subunit alpha-2/delta-1 [Larimichthys crocea]|uniref:Voltage-dependent calcium channel subunit alpha-2/delta-1 n=1 Tax=Larimichthys crocea TaxID=215358 RepID=A0A6G0HQ42_LARCR|nr:voltage-dependent calcium channel subunit alpha-2/delta-1 isoform X3 [Larimichthys crocea]KAE8281378.1 Voltage-dependent calcium channel subunit alpha-2/delta-1 [Larimichthys crocea]
MDYSICLLLLLSTISSVSVGQFPTSKIIKDWVDQMQKELITLTDTASGMQHLIQIYHKHSPHFTVETNNAIELVATAAGNIERLLANRSEALKRLASEAERYQMEHDWMRYDSEDEKIVYYNAKEDLNQTEEAKRENKRYIPDDFDIDPDFKRLVSYNTTAVHIPTDIYERSTIILNELNWTEALEDVFRKNKEEDPSLLWQVFGSATGLARYYPASPWINSSNSADKIDLYDVRMRPWYIQGAASPKDMLILVDASGSISGLTLKLIRTSVSKMLETLSDDDYVNVVYFNDQARYASCFENLVQANVRNKKKLKEAVQEITAKGITNYRSGFELAFKQLAQMNVSRANCNKIIMLFTDGGEEKAEEIFKKYNPNQAVRIFTFSVGQHNYDKGPIQWMACANKGYYYEIPSIGAIRINTQEYLDVLGRPMVKESKKAKQVQWTNVYLDALELGLVITGTLPVFNKTNTGSKKAQKFQNQLILGVMAIDVSLEDIKRLTPRFTFGPNGYYFAIDPNGYVLLHPNLQPLTAKFDEPVTLDFLDAELESDIKVEIRKQMIDGNHGNYTISTLVKSQDERYIDLTQRTYTFAPVKGTDYSLALVLPEYSKHYIQANIGDTITQAKFSESLLADKFDEYGYTFIAPRVYCKDLKPPEKDKNNTEFLMEFNNYIDTKTPNHPLCNVELVNRLLLDAGITSELIKIWKKKDLQHGVLARFVATDGGITRVYPKSAGLSWKVEAETYESSVYKRSLDNDLYIFTPTPYPKENSSDDSVLVSRAVNININDITLKPAVVGVKLDISAWMASFINTTQRMNCNDEICGCQRNHPYVDCVILDDGGFLVMSNQDDDISQIGNFFGVIDPILMRNLVNSSLFTSKKTFDYQSLCDPKKKSKVAAGPRSVYVPTIADILNVGWWATAAAWSVLQQLLVSITFPNFLDAAEMDDELPEAMRKEVCTTEQTQYYFETNQLTFRGNIDCENCTRMYHAEKLPKTNLVFIIADAKPTCSSCDTKPLIQDEQPSDGPNPCERAQNPRYRKGPAACFDNTEHEQDPDCGGVSGLAPSLWLMLALQLVLLWVLTGSRHHAIPS